MINPQDFTKLLEESGFIFFTGIPDSTMKEWLKDLSGRQNHIIATSGGEALAIASGYYLASGQPGCVYLQNAGLGNMINPLASLCDKEVYSLPTLLVIGWRGEPGGGHDEPQHVKMGKITLPLLDTLEIPHSFLPDNLEGAKSVLLEAKRFMEAESAPYAIIVKKDLFEKFAGKKADNENFEMTREEAIKIIIDALPQDSVIVSTTGKTSRELFEYRKAKGDGRGKDFLTVGSMGFANAIAFGIAQSEKNKKVVIFDGDGAAMMHLGNMATIGHSAPANFLHILFDNCAYESTGGQQSISASVDFLELAQSLKYKSSHFVDNEKDLAEIMPMVSKMAGPVLLAVKVKSWSRADLSRPDRSPQENKKDFMKNLQKI